MFSTEWWFVDVYYFLLFTFLFFPQLFYYMYELPIL